MIRFEYTSVGGSELPLSYSEIRGAMISRSCNTMAGAREYGFVAEMLEGQEPWVADALVREGFLKRDEDGVVYVLGDKRY